MFDFIAAIDKRDEDKCKALYNLIASNTEHVMALTPTGGGYTGAMTRYCDIPNVITAKWCKEFADEAKEITGLETVSYTHLDVYKRQGRYCIIFPK